MIDLQPLIDPGFWFSMFPGTLSPVFEKVFFLLFAIMMIVGAVVRITARHRVEDRHMLRTFGKIGKMFIVMGILGMVWFFFTFEGTYFLGARFWFLLWTAGLIAWIVAIVRYVRVTIPAEKAEKKNREEFNKYLPRR